MLFKQTMFSYFLKFIFLILFFEDVFFFSLEAKYFIASDLSVLGKKVVKLHDKHEQCFLMTLHFTV